MPWLALRHRVRAAFQARPPPGPPLKTPSLACAGVRVDCQECPLLSTAGSSHQSLGLLEVPLLSGLLPRVDPHWRPYLNTGHPRLSHGQHLPLCSPSRDREPGCLDLPRPLPPWASYPLQCPSA